MKRWQIIFLLALVAGTIYIMRAEHPGKTYRNDEGFVFGTVYHATYESEASLKDSIMAELMRVDASMSMFNPSSTVSLINRGEAMQTDTLMRIVYSLSHTVSEATGGAFDITVAPLVNAWGFGFKNDELPDSAAVDSLLSFVGYRGINLLPDGTLTKADERMVIDFSAVAKGFGVDLVARMFARLGVENYMIEIGGEVVCKGVNAKGNKWTIGINRPVDDPTSTTGDVMATLSASDIAIATSGNYRNYYITDDGRRLAHTISPLTGWPVQIDVVSTTVVAPTCAMAAAYAAAFMVLGLDGAKAVCRQHPELKAYLVYEQTDGKLATWCSEDLDVNEDGH